MPSSGIGPATSSVMKSMHGRSAGGVAISSVAVGKASNKSRAVLKRSLCDIVAAAAPLFCIQPDPLVDLPTS